MFGAMFIGLSGMNAYSNGLRQVSNNITNLNSNGFRATTIGFNDLFGSGTSGVSYTRGGGGNGTGVQLSVERLDFSQGEIRQTDNDLDLAIEGNGFLVLENGGDYYYSRTGSFEVNNDGFIVLAGTDYKLTVLDDSGRATSLSLDSYRIDDPEATTRIQFGDNLSSTATEFLLSDVRVYNAEGAADNWEIAFNRAATDPAGEWKVKVTNGAGDVIGEQDLTFTNGIIDAATAELEFSDAAGGRTVTLDFSDNVTSFSSGEVSTLRAADIDGFGIGEITTVAVNEDGVLEIQYSNEQSEELGAITIADFEDVQSLERAGAGLFTYDRSTGRELLSSASDRVGLVRSNRIEASNVDLSQQFGDLILVQRGYQASSQVVSVSNDMIQQLFGLRGQ